MKRKIYTFIAIAALLIGMGNVAQAQKNEKKSDKKEKTEAPQDMNRRGNLRAMGAHGLMGIADLTDDQISKIKDIRLNEQKQSMQLQNQISEKNAKLRTLETADKADLKEINKVIDETMKLQGDAKKLQAESKQKIRTLLTEEQRIQFDSKGRYVHTLNLNSNRDFSSRFHIRSQRPEIGNAKIKFRKLEVKPSEEPINTEK